MCVRLQRSRVLYVLLFTLVYSSTHAHAHTHTGSSCVACKTGFYKALPGAAACEGCPAGKYVGSIAAVKCQDCGPHSASTSGSASCFCVAVCVCARVRPSIRARERESKRRLHSIHVPKQQCVSVHAYTYALAHRATQETDPRAQHAARAITRPQRDPELVSTAPRGPTKTRQPLLTARTAPSTRNLPTEAPTVCAMLDSPGLAQPALHAMQENTRRLQDLHRAWIVLRARIRMRQRPLGVKVRVEPMRWLCVRKIGMLNVYIVSSNAGRQGAFVCWSLMLYHIIQMVKTDCDVRTVICSP